MKTFIQNIVISTVIFSAIYSSMHAKAAPYAQAFGERWQSKGALVNDQAQIIYYRTKASDSQQAALVTVNGKLHAALLPGMYTRICVQPGSYMLGSEIDFPGTEAIPRNSFQVTLKPGKIYFVRLSAQGDGKPEPVRRLEAERELAALRLQEHVLSRANVVIECRYQVQPMAEYNIR
ncbi:DUF2846 domain-containing protein [Pantoea dispersa]|uniref:hypothetical protein n=1 Tax=Pantoea dispersa TaxID=59814 RepID=UPI002DB626E2|nr:hypothetical protein [Pantoea dispersa]MEB5974907.1 DUF2846 domain-containing protein [Pantoea dispersa]